MGNSTSFTARCVCSSRVSSKNPDQTIKELLGAKIAELGENIVIRRFTRYLVGEPLAAEA